MEKPYWLTPFRPGDCGLFFIIFIVTKLLNMKSLFFAAVILMIFLSSNAQEKAGAAAQKNLVAANAINKAIETGDVSSLDKYIADDATDHSNMSGDVKGVEKIKAGLAGVHKMASGDMKLEVKKELADGEYVFQWIYLTGTAATTDMGVAVGSKFSLNTIGVSKYKNGKATDYWEFMQPAELMKMMSGPAK
jgi:ketosteroid isomerase-like protein